MRTEITVAFAFGVVLLSAAFVSEGLHDIADSNRRQAAATCIDSWHAWVRGTYTNVQYPDVEYCMLLSGVQPPPGMEDKMFEAALHHEDVDAKERIAQRERDLKVDEWWLRRQLAELELSELCAEAADCHEHLEVLAGAFPP